MLRSSRMGRCISILARSKTTPAQSSCSLSLGRFPPRLTNNSTASMINYPHRHLEYHLWEATMISLTEISR